MPAFGLGSDSVSKRTFPDPSKARRFDGMQVGENKERRGRGSRAVVAKPLPQGSVGCEIMLSRTQNMGTQLSED